MGLRSLSPESLALVGLILLAFVGPAGAQAIGEGSPLETNSVDAALDFRDSQSGLHTGTLRWLPSAEVSLAYDSNVFATPAPRSEEALSIIQAQLGIADDSDVVRVDGGAFARARRYAGASDQGTNEYGASIGLATQSSSSNQLSAQLLAQRQFESRIDIETPDIHEVSLYDQWRTQLAFTHAFNRLSVRASADLQQLDYLEESQRFRDLFDYRGELEVDYGLRSGIAFTATGYYGEDRYRYASPLLTSAHTQGALLGVRSAVTEVIEAEFSAGYFHREFSGQAGGDSGLTLRGAASWWPTRLTTVRAELLREDSGTQVAGAVAKVRTDGSLEVAHQYSRRFNLFARGRVVDDDFADIDRNEWTYMASVGAERLFGSHFVLAAEYDYASRQSGVIAEGFVRHVVSVSLRGVL